MDKTTGLPVASPATDNIDELLAVRNQECGKPAKYKIEPFMGYTCEEHAEKLRPIANLQLIPL